MPAGSETSGTRGRRFRLGWVGRTAAATAAVGVFAATGYGWAGYSDLEAGIRRSGALVALAAPPSSSASTALSAAGQASAPATQNLLVIGLDSRLDENGDPLPPAVYQAMDTGGPDVGGYNANVLMLLHVPGDGSRATAVSIPRDDYVALPGWPDGVAAGKICECRCGTPGWECFRLGAGNSACLAKDLAASACLGFDLAAGLPAPAWPTSWPDRKISRGRADGTTGSAGP